LLADSRLSRNMVLRKTIHLSGFLVPLIFVPVFNVYLVSAALFLLCVVYAASEAARIRGFDFPVLSVVTRRAAKSVLEMNGFATAPVTFALGIAFSLLVFPAPIAYVSIAVLTLGDGCACVFGVILGKTPLFHNRSKTVEGSICGFVCAFLGSILFVDPVYALVAVGVGMLVESIPFSFEDNLLVPLSSGITLMFLSFL
jgi:dolichol kinase